MIASVYGLIASKDRKLKLYVNAMYNYHTVKYIKHKMF